MTVGSRDTMMTYSVTCCMRSQQQVVCPDAHSIPCSLGPINDAVGMALLLPCQVCTHLAVACSVHL
jgi:hypothetical protein